MDQELLPSKQFQDVHFIAAMMADALETMHWEVKTDGRNVEFVLGGVPSNDERFLPSCEK